jgi:hypothetical protein
MSVFDRLDQRRFELVPFRRGQFCALGPSIWKPPIIAKDFINALKRLFESIPFERERSGRESTVAHF